MKIKSLLVALALSGLSVHCANAADGTLTFKGSIINSSCTLTGGNGTNIQVPLGSIPTSNFTKVTDKGPQVGFKISVTGCKPGVYHLILDGTTVSGEQNILALDSDVDNAKGVGIEVTGIDNAPITLSKELNAEDASVTVGEDGLASFLLKANYVAVANDVEAGKANATANFTIVQQ